MSNFLVSAENPEFLKFWLRAAMLSNLTFLDWDDIFLFLVDEEDCLELVIFLDSLLDFVTGLCTSVSWATVVQLERFDNGTATYVPGLWEPGKLEERHMLPCCSMELTERLLRMLSGTESTNSILAICDCCPMQIDLS